MFLFEIKLTKPLSKKTRYNQIMKVQLKMLSGQQQNEQNKIEFGNRKNMKKERHKEQKICCNYYKLFRKQKNGQWTTTKWTK